MRGSARTEPVSSVELVLPIRTHRRRIRVHFGTEVAETDQGFGLAGVLKGHAGFRAVLCAEVFVLGQFVKADELRADERLAINLAAALHADQTVGSSILYGAFGAGIDGKLLGGEELFAI